MSRRCEWDDESQAFVMSRGPITDEDRKALSEFDRFLRCQVCTTRYACALNGCAGVALAETDRDDEGNGGDR